MSTADNQGRVAGPVADDKRTTFLSEPFTYGAGRWNHATVDGATVGLNVFHSQPNRYKPQLILSAGPCYFTIYPTPEDLRLLARAFNMAADHAEALQRENSEVPA